MLNSKLLFDVICVALIFLASLLLALVMILVDEIDLLAFTSWVFSIPSSFWIVFIPAMTGLYTWYKNEHIKRIQNNFEKKEAKYTELLDTIEGFYIKTRDSSQTAEFVKNLRQLWMYAPDNIIDAANDFLSKVSDQQVSTDEEKEQALANLIIEIRKDLYHQSTKFSSKDYVHWAAN